MFDLSGKLIVFTGGTSRLCSCMAEGLAAQGAGLVIAGRDKSKSAEAAAGLRDKFSTDSMGLEMDVSDDGSVKAGIGRIIDRYGRIDVLINGASYSRAGKIDEMSFDDWKIGIDGTINNVFLCTRYTIPHMLAAGCGNIINISSMYGLVSPVPEVYSDIEAVNPANYGAGKAAILQFTRYLACYYGKRGIRANAVSPGPFPAEAVQRDAGFISNLSKRTALGRIGRPEELQGVIVFLASEESSYVTGQNISVDGGWTAW